MNMTDSELAAFIKATFVLRNAADAEQYRRATQRKLMKQRAELSRLTEENQKLKALANSRGQLLIDIQRRALEMQVENANTGR